MSIMPLDFSNVKVRHNIGDKVFYHGDAWEDKGSTSAYGIKVITGDSTPIWSDKDLSSYVGFTILGVTVNFYADGTLVSYQLINEHEPCSLVTIVPEMHCYSSIKETLEHLQQEITRVKEHDGW